MTRFAVVRRNFAGIFCAGVFCALTGFAAAQEGASLEVKVSDAASAGRLIKVPVNKSILLDFNQPVKEVRVAKPEIASVTASSPRQLVVTGTSFGVTQLIVWVDDKNQQIFDVACDIELDRLQASIASAVPRARVKANAVLDSVVLTGEVPDAESATRIEQIASVYSSKVMNQMHVVGTQQVLLRCTIAEVNRSAVRQLGFNGWIGGDNIRDVFGVSNLNGINPSNIGAAGGVPINARVPFLTGTDGIPITGQTTLSFGFPRVQMQVFVQALRENGLLRVLAEPNVVAINGQEAAFLAGGEIPIPIVTEQRIKIEYKEFGVRLTFKPAILGEDVIRLQVTPEVSEPDFTSSVTVSGVSVPGFTSRRVSTVVELGSGQTFAIGGLLSERSRGVARKVPGLGDIPVLGALFSSVEYQTDNSELVVLVTPELVQPVSPDQVTYVPGTKMVEPNDFDLFLMGSLEGKADPNKPALTPRIHNEWPARPADLYGGELNLKLRGPLGPAGFEEGT